MADIEAKLEQMGLTFHGPSHEPPTRVTRMHNVVPGATAYVAALQTRLLQYGGRVICDAEVRQILRGDDGVEGVLAQVDGSDRPFLARRGVVMAAGDYTNSPTLISRFKGERFSGVEGINPRSTGDGHKLSDTGPEQGMMREKEYGTEMTMEARVREQRCEE